MKRTSLFNAQFWIIITFAAGVLYLLALQIPVADGVYFSGDSGIRALLSQNFIAGEWRFDLDLSVPRWVKSLWIEGLSPYQPPFFYEIGEKYFITFPYTFSLVTAPLYSWFGYRGLYLVPLLSTLAIWLIFYRLCRKMNFHPAAAVTGTAFLIFTTNLSLYSAMYWEHTLSVGLAFAGLALFLPKNGTESIGFWSLFGAGVLSGLGVWFRPEQIFLVVFLTVVSIWSLAASYWKPLFLTKYINLGSIPRAIGKSGWVYPAAVILTLLVYGLTNWFIYNNFFGVHAIQVLEQRSLKTLLLNSLSNFRYLTVGSHSLFWFAPVTLFPIFYLFLNRLRPGQFKYHPDWTLWYFFCLAFLFGVSVLVPEGAGGKQWGARFLLLLVPVIVLLFTWQVDSLLKGLQAIPRKIRWAVALLVLILGTAGIIQNLGRGQEYLSTTYAQVEMGVEALRGETESLIAISDPYLLGVFQPAVSGEHAFLLVPDEGSLGRFSEALIANNEDSFSYICYSFECKLFDQAGEGLEVYRNDRGYLVEVRSEKKTSRYTILNVHVSQKP